MNTTTTTAAIAEALDELTETFADAIITTEDDGAGGAWVTISDVPLGPVYEQERSWMAAERGLWAGAGR